MTPVQALTRRMHTHTSPDACSNISRFSGSNALMFSVICLERRDQIRHCLLWLGYLKGLSENCFFMHLRCGGCPNSPPLPRCFQSRSSLHHFFSKKCFYQYFTLVVSQYRYVDGEMVESSLNVLQYGSFLLGLRPFKKTAVFLKKKVSRDEKSHLIHYFHCFATSVILFA